MSVYIFCSACCYLVSFVSQASISFYPILPLFLLSLFFFHHLFRLEDCLLAPLGEWSEWSVCLRDGVTCGFKWGMRTRVRQSSQTERAKEEKGASICPPQSETQSCRMKRKCSTGERERANSTLITELLAAALQQNLQLCLFFGWTANIFELVSFGHSRGINNAMLGGLDLLKTFQNHEAQDYRSPLSASEEKAEKQENISGFSVVVCAHPIWYYKTKVIKFGNFIIKWLLCRPATQRHEVTAASSL